VVLVGGVAETGTRREGRSLISNWVLTARPSVFGLNTGWDVRFIFGLDWMRLSKVNCHGDKTRCTVHEIGFAFCVGEFVFVRGGTGEGGYVYLTHLS
jgi:hypothetical protein